MTPVTINGRRYDIDLPDDTPLLWALRDQLGLTGTKFGCGMALCGACTVHVKGQPVRSCITPISSVTNKKIVTIEAVGGDPIGQALQAGIDSLGFPNIRLTSEEVKRRGFRALKVKVEHEPEHAHRHLRLAGGAHIEAPRALEIQRAGPRDALLQQQRARLEAGVGLEPLLHRAIEQQVGERQQHHALVVRHEGANDDA